MQVVCHKCKTPKKIAGGMSITHGSTDACKKCGASFAFFVVPGGEAKAAASAAEWLPSQFSHTNYTIKKQFFKIFGGAFRVYDPMDNLVFYSKQKAFKLKEDIRVYADESMTDEILTIRARQAIDFSASYDVEDPKTKMKVGALRRKGLRSILRDEWLILDAGDREIGSFREDKTHLALIRRFLFNFIPQSFTGRVGEKEVFDFSQRFNPFVLTIDLDFGADTAGLLDRRLGVACAVILCAIEGRQRS